MDKNNILHQSMVDIIPEGKKGIALVEHYEISEEDAQFENMRNAVKGMGLMRIKAGKYVRLRVNGEVVMSDTQMERRTNLDVVSKSNGDVLIAGLGIGLILSVILRKEEVKSVIVIEKSQDVIDLVASHFQDSRLKVIQGDIFDWKPEKGQKFDVIYFDIWSNLCSDNLEQIKKLHNKFKFKLNRDNPDCWMGSWVQDELKYYKKFGY